MFLESKMMLFRTIRIFCVIGMIIVLMIIVLFNGNVLAGPGSCERFDFPRDKEGKIDWPNTVKVLKQDAVVYEDAISLTEVPNLRLNFNDKLNVLDVQENRVQVRRVGGYQPLGWMSRSDLLCAMKPLKDENTGLERKLYIRTATEERGEKPATMTAYPSPDLRGEPLRELSWLTGYFVFDEALESYLLGDTYLLDDTSRLVGWVSKKYGFIWNTTYGLRPREEFEDKTICAYRKLEDAFSDPIGKCIPILGGKRWYKYPDRIPIIDRIQHQGKDFYKVVLPIAATGAEYDPRTGTIKSINPAQFAENRGIESILEMKNVDVLFLIDGTQSMGPYIDAIRGSPENNYRDGVVQQIMRDLQADPAFREVNFRFGFQIYRDWYAGQKEFGESYPLSDRCEEKQDLRGFYQAFAQVEELKTDQDDFPENLYGGLEHAIEHLSPCSNNTKLLFVIGDCGYDAEAQQRRGRTPVNVQALIREISGSIGNQKKSFVLFFIQTPNISDSFDDSQKRQKYNEAYSLFTTQAKDILRQLYLSGQSRWTTDISNYFLTLPESTERMQILTEKIVAGVKDFSNMEPIHELILDLRGGAALTEAIERLKGSEEYRNIPGLFWDSVEQGRYREIGPQCREQIYNIILDGYIPVSDDVVEDVWLKLDDLRKWENLCNKFEDMSGVESSKLRETFVFTLKDVLEKLFRKPLYEETREPLKEYLQRKVGLPVRDTSPLFNYSIDDLRDPRTVPDCELIRLSIWIKRVGQILGIVTHGDLRPVYRKISFPDQCPSGEDIPYIDADVKTMPLGDSDMRYDHSFQKAHVYWVPKEFLP